MSRFISTAEVRVTNPFDLFFLSVYRFFRAPKSARRIAIEIMLKQIFFTGAQAIAMFTLTGLFVGGAVVLEVATVLTKVGITEAIGKILTTAVVRELGPLLTALMIAARSGTAIAAEISSTIVNEEYDSIVSMGIDPLVFIVFPRIAGVSIASFFLTFYFIAAGIFGGFLLVFLLVGTPYDVLLENFVSSLSYLDIFIGFIKGLFFGAIAAIIPISRAMKVSNSPTEVPVATMKAVVSSIFVIFLMNAVFDVVIYI